MRESGPSQGDRMDSGETSRMWCPYHAAPLSSVRRSVILRHDPLFFYCLKSLARTQGFLYQCLPEDSTRRKETPDGASLSATQGTAARRLSGPPLPLPRGDRTAGGLCRAVRGLAPQPREPAPFPHLPRRLTLRRRAEERRGDRLPLRPRPPGHPALRRRARLGPRPAP